MQAGHDDGPGRSGLDFVDVARDAGDALEAALGIDQAVQILGPSP